MARAYVAVVSFEPAGQSRITLCHEEKKLVEISFLLAVPPQRQALLGQVSVDLILWMLLAVLIVPAL
ncbi:hypothetical protein IRJ41_007505 [Triplophysa rosa]|uniref:Uncharacterized protein n=1 Tax=Triplophysa rosa TaxID=992332 RepID=A0A9W7WHC5_TRIRA|nr:hypothetical protein IRJ41_007505 [Triplophysa rosa]